MKKLSRIQKLSLAFIVLASFLLYSCHKEEFEQEANAENHAGLVYDNDVELGKQIEDPYKIQNIQIAYQSLRDSGLLKTDYEIKPNYLYVRFLPRDTQDYNLLALKYKFELFNYPLDFELKNDVDYDYYHDKSVPADQITWQYTVIPIDQEIPAVKYEIMYECYIPEDDELKSTADRYINDLLVYESSRLTGTLGDNPEKPSMQKASWNYPSGVLTLYRYNSSGTMISGVGLREVKVRARRYTKIATIFTNSNGYYRFGKSYKYDVRYKIIFENKIGFKIRGNANFITTATHSLGRHSSSGVSQSIFKESNAWLYASINDAAWWYYLNYCDYFRISRPPSNLLIWAPRVSAGNTYGNAPMARQIGLSVSTLTDLVAIAGAAAISGGWSLAFSFCSPDIMIFGNYNKSSDLYTSVWHEMAHASHYSKAGKSFWLSFIGQTVLHIGYGNRYSSTTNIIGVGEMWAYFFEYVTTKAYWGQASFTTTQWFKPQIMKDLKEDEGFSVQQIFSGLSSSSSTHYRYKDYLINNYDKDEQVRRVFSRHGF